MWFFSLAVLEGIAISFNPNYKVLGSSYPWIARKVLTDSSPKLRSTLQTLLYKVDIFQHLYSLTILNHSNCVNHVNKFTRSIMITNDCLLWNIFQVSCLYCAQAFLLQILFWLSSFFFNYYVTGWHFSNWSLGILVNWGWFPSSNIVVLSYVIYDICDINKDLMFETCCKFFFLTWGRGWHIPVNL